MSPMNLADYHSDWKWIAKQIRDQAGNCCEFCGAPNKSVWRVNERGERFRDDDGDLWSSDAGRAWMAQSARVRLVTVVLTVAHLCHVTQCYDPTHLRALCQRCHLNLDREHRRDKRRGRY